MLPSGGEKTLENLRTHEAPRVYPGGPPPARGRDAGKECRAVLQFIASALPGPALRASEGSMQRREEPSLLASLQVIQQLEKEGGTLPSRSLGGRGKGGGRQPGSLAWCEP